LTIKTVSTERSFVHEMISVRRPDSSFESGLGLLLPYCRIELRTKTRGRQRNLDYMSLQASISVGQVAIFNLTSRASAWFLYNFASAHLGFFPWISGLYSLIHPTNNSSTFFITNCLCLLSLQLADFERARYSYQSTENKYRRQIYVR